MHANDAFVLQTDILAPARESRVKAMCPCGSVHALSVAAPTQGSRYRNHQITAVVNKATPSSNEVVTTCGKPQTASFCRIEQYKMRIDYGPAALGAWQTVTDAATRKVQTLH